LIAKTESHCTAVHPKDPVKYTKHIASGQIKTGSGGSKSLSSVSKDEYEQLMRTMEKSSKMNCGRLNRTADSDDEEPEVDQCDDTEDENNRTDHDDSAAARKYAKPSTVKIKTASTSVPTTGVAGRKVKVNRGATGHYQCRQCHYTTYRPTMMKQHAMSHFQYYPYVCPYCNGKRAVRSVEVHKHIRLKHPERSDVRADYRRNEEIEVKVKFSFYRIKKLANRQEAPMRNGCDQNLGELTGAAAEKNTNKGAGSSQTDDQTTAVEGTKNGGTAEASDSTLQGSKRVIYKCVNCGLKTQQRNDMRYHLMRELHYKPFTLV
jgi:ribosomal protein L37AE/L43A